MPSVPISQLPPVSEVSPSAYVPIDQDGVTKRATVAQIGTAAQDLTQSFVTVGSESGTLPNSRSAGATNGITRTDSGAGGTLTFSLTGQALNFFLLSTTGLVSLTGGGSVVSRALVGPGKGFTISNADGVAGNPTFALTGGLLALEDLTGPGVVCSTGVDTFAPRTLTGTANQIDITEGQGAGGNPTFAIADDPRLPGTGGFLPPGGTTAQRPLSPPVGFTRRNTDLNVNEAWDGAQWVSQGVAGVTSVGAQGANGISVAGSPITTSGTLTIGLDATGVTADSYGDASTVPVLTINAQGQVTDATTATITPASIGGVPTSRTLTAGTGLTGGGDLSADRTFAVEVPLPDLTGQGTNIPRVDAAGAAIEYRTPAQVRDDINALATDGDASQAVAGGRVLQDVAGAVAGLDVGSSTEVLVKAGATLRSGKFAGGDATSVPSASTSLISDTKATSWVMSDYVITMSGVASYADAGATRSVARAFGAANGYADHTADTLIRAGEFHTLRATGTLQTTQGGTWGVEIGVHSQVAGDGSSKNIGAYIASSHTGWLASGTKADCGIKVCGEDGWYYYERFHDETDALKWYVKNNGDLYTAGAIGVGTTSPQTFAGYGTVCVNGTTGSFYDVNVNGSNKLRIQATSGGIYIDSAGSAGSIDFRSSGGADANARLFDSGAVAFPRVGTTASAANAYLDNSAGNSLLRSTSSGVYKTDVETLDPQYADAVLSLRPVWYRSLADADRKDWSWYGLIAEEVAAIEPRLVHYRQPTKMVTRTVTATVPVLEEYEDLEPLVEVIDGRVVRRLAPVTKQRQAIDVLPITDEAGNPVMETVRAEVRDDDGNVVEPAIARQAVYVVPRVATEEREVTEEVPDLDAAPIPDGVQYERLTVMLLDIARRLTDRVTALEAQLAALQPTAE